MTLQEFVSQGWGDHGDDAEGVFGRFPEGVDLVTEPDDIPQLAALIVHVAGEHLGRWQEGLDLLGKLAKHDVMDAESPSVRSLFRSMAILHHCAGDDAGRATAMERGRSGADHPESDEIRVLAIAASALCGQGRVAEATDTFTRALELAAYGPEKGDPAATALAVTGNNLACALEQKTSRTRDEDGLMLQAAEAGRRFWEISGNWMNVERAEYRLAHTHLQLADATAALRHARLCLDVCTANDADAGELFFAHEALAKCHHAAGDDSAATTHRDETATQLEKIDDEGFKSFCKAALGKLSASLG